jgi:Polyketide cyclase / dehydrase and lipid transport
MAKAYYSTVFEQPAPQVWKIVRDFNNYPVWVGGAGESRIEDGKSGDTVGAIRNVLYQGRHIRQRLLAQSDVERSQTYEFCGPASLPVTGFQATLRITPVVDGDRAFVEWWATLDCDAACRDELTGTLRGWFGKWLESLRTTLGQPPGSRGKPPQSGLSAVCAPFWTDSLKLQAISGYPTDF